MRNSFRSVPPRMALALVHLLFCAGLAVCSFGFTPLDPNMKEASGKNRPGMTEASVVPGRTDPRGDAPDAGAARPRLFAGVEIEPTEALLAQLEECRQVLGGSIRWVPPEQWHLTLAFFGATDPERIPLLDEILAATAREFDGPIPLDLGGITMWGNERRGVLIVKIEAPALVELQANLARRLREAGMPADEREYVPHLTLGRTKQGERTGHSWRHCRELPGHRQTVGRIILFESKFVAGGVVYSHRNQYPLTI
ncbi:MAG: RNA 2',3'-cyclic phosphodiesterase [Lentisphaerae bacterium]|nr:RNA 2',3'-cyclic phosphodiesterase [Lentisphaerota bacterium]